MKVISKLFPKYRYFWDGTEGVWVIAMRKRIFYWVPIRKRMFEKYAKALTKELNATN